MSISLFHSSFHLFTPSHFISIVSFSIAPVCKPIKLFTILNVLAGENLVVSNPKLYTITSPVALSYMVKHPSTLFSSKYFFRLLSILAVLTEQELRKMKNEKLKIKNLLFEKYFIIIYIV